MSNFHDDKFAEMKAALDEGDPDTAAQHYMHGVMESQGGFEDGMEQMTQAAARWRQNQ